MSRIAKAIAHEIRSLIPVWLFFFLTFSLLRLTQNVILDQYGLALPQRSLVLVGSLVVAKVFLLIDHMKFVDRFRDRPMIYNVLWKTGIYFVAVLAVLYVEQLLEYTHKFHDFSIARKELNHFMSLPRFWIINLWTLLLLFAFSAVRDSIRNLGKQQFFEMWFFGAEKSRPESSKSKEKRAA